MLQSSRSHSKPSKTGTVLVTGLLCVLWLAALGCGFTVMHRYESSPGSAGAPQTTWSARSSIKLTPGIPTLIMAVHPQCPCTRASIGELAQLMAHAQGKVATYVLFVKLPNTAEGWEKTDLWRSAAAIPGVTVLCDADGREARCFGLETSGHTLLFDKAGRLQFSGGITDSRGHSGESVGEDSILSLLDTGASSHARTSVFGCSLFGSAGTNASAVCLAPQPKS